MAKAKFKFNDKTGREWTIHLTDSVLGEIKRLFAVDLRLIEDVRSLADDPALLVNCIYVACREQADKRGVSDIEFGTSLASGKAIDAATVCILKECRRHKNKR